MKILMLCDHVIVDFAALPILSFSRMLKPRLGEILIKVKPTKHQYAV